MDPHDTAALRHYEALIALHYPPHLAAALAAARYQVCLSALSLPALRDVVRMVKDTQPRLQRAAGRLLVEVEKEMGKTQTHHDYADVAVGEK